MTGPVLSVCVCLSGALIRGCIYSTVITVKSVSNYTALTSCNTNFLQSYLLINNSLGWF